MSKQVWESIPSIQYHSKCKKLKCSSQQQYTIIDNVPVFTTTGTNVTRPGLKRKWASEREDLLEGIKRIRGQPLQPDDFKSPALSKRRGIKNQQDGEDRQDHDISIDASCSSSSGLNVQPISAMERMQAKFRAKFAKTQHVQSSICMESAGSPRGTSTPHAASLSTDFPHSEHEQSTGQNASRSSNHSDEVIFRVKAKKVPPRPGVRVAGVKWGPTVKPKPSGSSASGTKT